MAAKALVKSEARARVSLSPAERELILGLMVYVLDVDVEDRLLYAPPTAKEVALTFDELDELAEHIAVHADHTTDHGLARFLYGIYDRVRRAQRELA